MSTNRFTDTDNKSFIKSCNTLTKLNPLESEFTPEVCNVLLIIFTFKPLQYRKPVEVWKDQNYPVTN